jgi:4-hydroxy-tetrahydrodipicolinate synthase
MSQQYKIFRGTGVALITPFTPKGSIDFPALKKIVEYIIKNKCEYLVVMGTTGESAVLSETEKKDVIEFVRTVNNKRIPLVLGIGGNNTKDVVDEIKSTNLNGYSAILSVSPYYNKPTQEGIYQHYKKVSKASDLPVILYNVPARTSSNITSETTLRLANDFKNIIAIKEASGNFDQCMTIIKNRPANFLVISGDDNITMPLIASGADGVISVVANAYPSKFSEMVRSALADDMKKARKIHYDIFNFIPLIFEEGNPCGIKSAMNAMKLCGPDVRLPLVQVSKELRNKIANFVKKH